MGVFNESIMVKMEFEVIMGLYRKVLEPAGARSTTDTDAAVTGQWRVGDGRLFYRPSVNKTTVNIFTGCRKIN